MSNIKAFAAVLFACACAHVGAEIYGNEFYDPTGSISQYGQLGYSEIKFKGGTVQLGVNDAGVLTPVGKDVEEWEAYKESKKNDFVFTTALAALEKAITSEMMVRDTGDKMAAILNGGSVITIPASSSSEKPSFSISYNSKEGASITFKGVKDSAKTDGESVGKNSDGELEIFDFSTGPDHGFSLEDAIAWDGSGQKPLEKMQMIVRDTSTSGQYGISYVPFGLVSNVTTNFDFISFWLGSYDNARGTFARPKKIDGSDFGRSASILDFLGEYGVVGYLPKDHEGTLISSNKYGFVESDVGEQTRVTATFDAPYNWADGGVIVCTDGVFRATVAWATNWTEAVEHITNTHEIVSMVTNLVSHEYFVTNLLVKTHEDFITNTFNHVDFITNTFEHVNVVTNIFNHEDFVTNVFNYANFVTNTFNHVDFITNTFEHVNVVTNIFNHEDFVTNVFNYANFVTNTFNHINMITNVYTHEDFVTNTFNETHYTGVTNFFNNILFKTNSTEIVNVITNFYNHESFVTNFLSNETFVTNFIEQSNSFTNWHEVFNVTTNVIGVTTNMIVVTQSKLGLPSAVDRMSPDYDPTEDPYSPDYDPPEGENEWDNSPLVAAVRNVQKMTNVLASASNGDNSFAKECIWTNKLGKIEIAGFTNDGDEPDEDGEYLFFRSISGGVVTGDWVDAAGLTNLNVVAALRDSIKNVNKYLSEFATNSTFVSIVQNATNYEAFTKHPFQQVAAGTLLDNVSVWTNGDEKIEIKGFADAPLFTVPMKDKYNEDVFTSWTQIPMSDDSARTKTEENLTGSSIVESMIPATDGGSILSMSIYGFQDADVESVPVKVQTGADEDYILEWRDSKSFSSALKFIGTDTNSVVVGVGSTTNNVTFSSASDSNVKVSVTGDGNGGVNIKIGVYYR